MGPEFFQTYMGRKYYERDVPRIVEALERIAMAMEKQIELSTCIQGDPNAQRPIQKAGR